MRREDAPIEGQDTKGREGDAPPIEKRVDPGQLQVRGVLG